jgi:antibiotic biosynthesis monooxygenase (ABM) superfamily enzyme
MHSKLVLTPVTDGRVVLPSLLIEQIGCALLIWFAHNPGLQLWVALPIINGFVTFWLMAKPSKRQTSRYDALRE